MREIEMASHRQGVGAVPKIYKNRYPDKNGIGENPVVFQNKGPLTMAHYLVSIEFRGGRDNEQKMNNVMFKLGASKVSQTEWVLATFPSLAIDIYKRLEPLTAGCGEMVVKEVEQETAWDGLVVSSDTFFQMLKSKQFDC